MKNAFHTAHLVLLLFLSASACAAAKDTAKDYINSGDAKYLKRDMDGAITDYNRALENNPQLSEAYNNRGNAKQGKGDLEGAIADYNRAIEINPQYSEAYNGRGAAKYDKGDLDGVIADCNRAIEIDPKYVIVYTNRAMAKYGKGDLDGAIADITRFIKSYHMGGDYTGSGFWSSDTAADAYSARGMFNHLKSNWKDAVEDYRKGSENIGDADVGDILHLRIWIIRARLGEVKAADNELVDHLHRYVNHTPSPWVFKIAGHFLGTVTEADLFAAADSSDTRKKSGQFCEAWYYAGMKKIVTGDKKSAANDLRKCLATKMKDLPEFKFAQSELKALGEDEGDLDGAIADIEINPKDSVAYCSRGIAKARKGDLEGAIADFTRAIEINPKLSEAYNDRGYAKQAKGDPDGAIADFNRAIEENPKNVGAYGGLAHCNYLQANWTDALAAYRHACELDKQGSSLLDYYQLYIWIIRARLGEVKAADKELTAYLDKRWSAAPNDWVSKLAGHLLGTVTQADLFAAADSPDSRKKSGQFCEAWYYAGMKKLVSGDKKSAAAYFRKCLATKLDDFTEFKFAQSELKALGGS